MRAHTTGSPLLSTKAWAEVMPLGSNLNLLRNSCSAKVVSDSSTELPETWNTDVPFVDYQVSASSFFNLSVPWPLHFKISATPWPMKQCLHRPKLYLRVESPCSSESGHSV